MHSDIQSIVWFHLMIQNEYVLPKLVSSDRVKEKKNDPANTYVSYATEGGVPDPIQKKI